MNLKIYISGPMSGLPDFNFPMFFEAENQLQELGFDFENPARNKTAEPTWENFMRLALAQLVRCDAILLLPGFEKSRGARVELEIAGLLGIKIFLSLEDLKKSQIK
jgi:uncharacterized protein DUF4406